MYARGRLAFAVCVICFYLACTATAHGHQFPERLYGPPRPVEKTQEDAAPEKPPKETPWFMQNSMIFGAVFFPFIDTKTGVIRFGGQITGDVDLEGDLGLPNNVTVGNFRLNHRFSPRNRVLFEYLGLHRSGDSRLSATISIGDKEFEIGTDIYSRLDIDLWRLSYGHSFIASNRAEVGYLVGLHIADIDFEIKSQRGLLSVEDQLTAPAPDLSLYGTYSFASRWGVSGEVQALGLSVGNVRGNLKTLNLALAYKVAKNGVVGVAYSIFDLDVSVSNKRGSDWYEAYFAGPMLFASYRL